MTATKNTKCIICDQWATAHVEGEGEARNLIVTCRLGHSTQSPIGPSWDPFSDD